MKNLEQACNLYLKAYKAILKLEEKFHKMLENLLIWTLKTWKYIPHKFLEL
jgi:hypothetical protein